ncbi:unnamed protein product [Clonostachys rosea f. rosea IK726]|uniref:Rab-GAP TBC domain-containing protein n=2 Tax=Bionectria ochroleuca TaxID=29856 RepID=A0A0B7K9I7_BIOOC|nr:unnamed protein product [Clonostachys rosea f. rosea IK726]
MSPTTAEFPDSRIPGTRLLKNAGPPPVSATRPQYGFGRTDSSGSAPILGGSVPWSGGEELRSSFRSQLTASTAPGTANTERSSVLTKNSSATSFGDNADAFVDPDEPSLEDVMGMYEQGFEDDIYEHSEPGDDQDEEFPPRPSSSFPQPEPDLGDSRVLDDPPDSPMLAKTRLDAEIRQSKMFFSSPAFMASVPHLASNLNSSNRFDETNRDSAKSLDTDPSDSSQPTVTSDDPTDRGLGISNNFASRDTSPSPAPTSVYDSRPSSPDPPPRDPSYPESCLPPDVPGPAEPEDPNSRDRYGFKKENQYVTMKQYDNWNSGYTEYLARRKKKWQSYLKEHSLMTENPNRFPPTNAKTKKFVRKGIPPEWRGAAWFYYAGGPAILAKHSGLYGKMLDMKAKRVDVEAIERDLHRTFPDNINFKPPQAPDGDNTGKPSKNKEQPIIASLRRVLFAFSIYNPHIGYCQSLNFIAGLLLLFVDTEEQCFWLLNVITHIYLPGTHEISLEGSKVDLGVLMTEIRDTMPAIWDKIGGDLEAEPQTRPSTGRSFRKPRTRFRRKQTDTLSTERLPPITLCMTAWFMSCFIGTLPIETTLRVWDIFFYEGSKTLFRTALAVFKTGESEIMAVADPMEMFGVVQAMPRRMLDANGLIDACFKRRNGFSHLSQVAIDERRQERRDQAQLDKDKQGGRSQTLPPGGNVTDAESEVRRKGTLFGRRRRDVSGTRPGRV